MCVLVIRSYVCFIFFFFFKQKTAYEMRISDWSSDVCSSDLLIRKAGGEVTCVLTNGGAQFVTAMTLAALSENKVYTNLFDLKDETEMGHIQQIGRASCRERVCQYV